MTQKTAHKDEPAQVAAKEGELPPGHGNFSANEPPGSNIGGTGEPPPVVLPPLVLTSMTPSSTVVTADLDFALAVTGSGFDANCVIVFDDEELTTTFDSETQLSARAPMATLAGIVDVEVARGLEDLSDVLTFEFTAVTGFRSSKPPERKAKKAEPVSKRAKKKR